MGEKNLYFIHFELGLGVRVRAVIQQNVEWVKTVKCCTDPSEECKVIYYRKTITLWEFHRNGRISTLNTPNIYEKQNYFPIYNTSFLDVNISLLTCQQTISQTPVHSGSCWPHRVPEDSVPQRGRGSNGKREYRKRESGPYEGEQEGENACHSAELQ